MSGGIGHYGVKEAGITPQVIDHCFRHVESIKHRLKPGESIEIAASAVEIYNDEFHDLSKGGKAGAGRTPTGWDPKTAGAKDLKLQVQSFLHVLDWVIHIDDAYECFPVKIAIVTESVYARLEVLLFRGYYR